MEPLDEDLLYEDIMLLEGQVRDLRIEVVRLRALLEYVLEDEPNLMPRATSSCRDHIRRKLMMMNER